MSVDNWTVCPKCKKLAQQAQEEDLQKLLKKYGEIPAIDFMADLNALNARPKPVQSSTLREDYQISIDINGKFSVNYRARCEICEFSFQFTHEKTKIV